MYSKALSEKGSLRTSFSSIESNVIAGSLAGSVSKEKKTRNGPIGESEILRKPADIREDPKYEGQTEVFLHKVPLHSVDERRDVDERALKEWIMYGIIEEDPFAQGFFDEIGKISKIIKEVETNLLNIPKLQFMDEHGQPMRDDRAREQREKLFDQYGQERVTAETRLENTERALKDHVAERKKMQIDLELCEVDTNSETATWRFKLSGSEDVDLIEDLLLQKMNWAGIKLAAGDPQLSPPLVPWAGRGALPSGKAYGIDYSLLQVNMLGVRVIRAPQGVGFSRSLDRPTSSLYDEDFGIYYGEYDLGLRHGYGIEINDTGVYTGAFEKGFRSGNGRLDLADGTTIIGRFSTAQISSLPATNGFKNPYLDGEPNGAMEIFFADGGYYKGQMSRGLLTGQGDYQSAFNEVQSGTFHQGLLDGDKGFHRSITGETCNGRFKHGYLQGVGSYLSPSGASHEGYWDQGMRHGRGITKVPHAGCYRGYYSFNLKHGKGSMEYGADPSREWRKKAKAAAKEAAAKAARDAEQGKPTGNTRDEDIPDRRDPTRFSDFDYVYLGYLHGNRPANRGGYMNCEDHVSHIISRSSRHAMDPILSALQAEEKIYKRHARVLDKFRFIESYMREEICRKKRKVFRQQKHLTKKMMYEDDVMGRLKERKQVESKLRLREHRLNKFVQKEGKGKGQQELDAKGHAAPGKNPLSAKAVVPRLRLLNTSVNRSLSDTYARLKPDKATLRNMDVINEDVLQIALSDFEEVRERQRFLKYDLLWQRAEEAFVKNKQDQL